MAKRVSPSKRLRRLRNKINRGRVSGLARGLRLPKTILAHVTRATTGGGTARRP